jgi:hypothetical protein
LQGKLHCFPHVLKNKIEKDNFGENHKKTKKKPRGETL